MSDRDVDGDGDSWGHPIVKGVLKVFIVAWIMASLLSAIFGIITSLVGWVIMASVLLVVSGWWEKMTEESMYHGESDERWWEDDDGVEGK